MLKRHISISYLFLILGAMFGVIYAVQLIGIATDLIRPDIARSLHISLMLYGFIPLMLSLLPFALFDKENVLTAESLDYLEKYFILWYIFLVFMILALLAGNTRSLPFYDFPYELNGILAFAGLFYIIAIFKSIKNYTIKPQWVKVSLALVIISPFTLLLLMNPNYGQVEQMHLGPHGDNTLGMSFALMAIYYLAIKLASPHTSFTTRWHILWIIPLSFYLLSVLYRSFVGKLSYEAEWFLQYLTLFYIPTLYHWWKDAGLSIKTDLTLLISILAFLFVDIEGNILFIPELRALFHRNDLVVGHAHIAVGIGVLFLALSIIEPYVKFSRAMRYTLTMLLGLMAIVLSISGISQAGFIHVDIETMWKWRALFGALFLAALLFWSVYLRRSTVQNVISTLTPLKLYHLIAFASDGLGGAMLLFFGKALYDIIEQPFYGGYQYIVFGFVTAVGITHLIGYLYNHYAHPMALSTSAIRIITTGGFFALYQANILGWIALAIAAVDFSFALVYLLYLKKDSYEKAASY
ncbi:hypothetical protein PGH07_05340 [Sulfurovum sp. zt1-1]|uniref:Cytochrome C and Quinol oxidase polypeptide I n=1 Tax=Sulfurovum zhangzhouensis TaxID=3019067 RepID=A0ABT7QXV5_9BACT|nr:hypothetical protein [Sulfurovum zhangzhouensis]MDM5271591.1 hypothetical protein [Sulfurovum zhangzhouensis]